MGRQRKFTELKRIPIIGMLALLALTLGCDRYIAKPLEAPDFKELIEDNPDLQLVDVRTFDEFHTGHIPDAYNINFQSPQFKAGLDTLDRNKPVAVYCLVGQRSAEAYKMLVDMDFKKVYHLTGGTVAWRRENYEVNEGAGRYKLR